MLDAVKIGGLMTYGSIVTREDGLPAVVEMHQVTTRLKTSQQVRVGGHHGRATVLVGT
jgi:rifampicin phosphotransferase